MRYFGLLFLLPIAFAVAGCGTDRLARAVRDQPKNECRLTPEPTRALRGADAYTENWLDETTENHVAVCKWKRVR